MKPPLERCILAAVTVVLTTLFLTREDSLDWSHVVPRIVVGVIVAVIITLAYFCFHLVRSTWLFHRETSLDQTQAARTREDQIEKLNEAIGHIQAKLGRPHIVLRYSVIEPPKPYMKDGTMIHEFRPSELLALNPSGYDAFEVCLTDTKFGRSDYRIESWKKIDLMAGQEARLPYRVIREDDGTFYTSLEYEHNLKQLLDKVSQREEGALNQLLAIPLKVEYKNATGDVFESCFVLTHHSKIWYFPKIEIAPPPVSAVTRHG